MRTKICASVSIARAGLKRFLGRLRVLLESSDGDAAEAFLAVERMLAGMIARSHLDALTTTIGEFDFETARKSLDGIAEDVCDKQTRELRDRNVEGPSHFWFEIARRALLLRLAQIPSAHVCIP